MERMGYTEDGGKENIHGGTKPPTETEKMAGEGTPPEMKEFWF